MKSVELNSETSLESLGFPCLEIVLAEGFRILPETFGEPSPRTIGELAKRVDLPYPQIFEKIQMLLNLSKDLFIKQIDDISISPGRGITQIDFDEGVVTIEAKQVSLHGFDLEDYCSRKDNSHIFIVVSQNKPKKVSAVYFLRQKGFAKSVALE